VKGHGCSWIARILSWAYVRIRCRKPAQPKLETRTSSKKTKNRANTAAYVRLTIFRGKRSMSLGDSPDMCGCCPVSRERVSRKSPCTKIFPNVCRIVMRIMTARICIAYVVHSTPVQVEQACCIGQKSKRRYYCNLQL
jgi:hypothetical protein